MISYKAFCEKPEAIKKVPMQEETMLTLTGMKMKTIEDQRFVFVALGRRAVHSRGPEGV